MKDKQIFQLHADICQALTHPIRLEIIDNLRGGEKRATHLAESLRNLEGKAKGKRKPQPKQRSTSFEQATAISRQSSRCSRLTRDGKVS